MYKVKMVVQNNTIIGRYFVLEIEPRKRDSLFRYKYNSVNTVNFIIRNNVLKIYDRMIGNDRLCRIAITIFDPLTEKQADALNTQRARIGYTIGGVISGAVSKIPTPFGISLVSGLAIGAGARKLVLNSLPTRHAGDIIVSLDALVKGGIGPQHSTKSISINRSEYDR